jgi:hypothetical protein
MEEKLFLNATEKTPLVNFDRKSGLLQIHGSSLPENPIEFYEPVMKWLNNYIENPNEKTEFDFKLVLLNTSSSKIFVDIFRKINKMVELNNSEVTIVWYYEIEDEDIHETAMQYKEFCKAPFKIIGTEHRLFE